MDSTGRRTRSSAADRKVALLDRLVVVGCIRPSVLVAAILGRGSPPQKWGYALALGITGLVAEIFYYLQLNIYRRPKNMPDPVFIIGHWRSATTYLHYELTSDKAAIATMRNSFTMAPQAALILKPLFTRIRMADGERPIDQVEWGIDGPQELDIAMTRFSSELPHLAVCQGFDPGKAFAKFYRSTPSKTFESQLRMVLEWGWLHDGNKGKKRHYIVKTPVLTSQITMLLRLYPKSKFVYVERNEEDTVASFTRILTTFNKLFGCWDYEDQCERRSELESWTLLKDAYERQKHLIPGNRLYEVKYDNLIENPKETVSKIRRHLNLQ